MGDTFEELPTLATFILSFVSVYEQVLLECIFGWEIFGTMFTLVRSFAYSRSRKGDLLVGLI